jgi:hypothetical protein
LVDSVTALDRASAEEAKSAMSFSIFASYLNHITTKPVAADRAKSKRMHG